MDMSVKLNLSYPAAKPAVSTTDKPAEQPRVEITKAAAANSSESRNPDNSEKLKTAVQEIEKFVQSVKRNLEFSIDEASGEIVVKVIASDTGEVVRQLPSAEAIKIAESLHNAHSLLFDAKV